MLTRSIKSVTDTKATALSMDTTKNILNTRTIPNMVTAGTFTTLLTATPHLEQQRTLTKLNFVN